ncbi:Replication termination factor 2 [Entamoeba marina]
MGCDVPGQKEKRNDRWKYCSLSHKPLKKRIVCDYVGRLYNREAILKALLNKEIPHELRYIHTRKDILDLNVTWCEKMIICPLRKDEFSPGHQFVALACGCVISLKGLEEIKSVKSEVCPVCSHPSLEYIKLNVSEDETQKLMEQFCASYDRRQEKRNSKEKLIKELPGFVTQPIVRKIVENVKVGHHDVDSDAYQNLFEIKSKRTAEELFYNK